jgi:hypothetical protein
VGHGGEKDGKLIIFKNWSIPQIKSCLRQSRNVITLNFFFSNDLIEAVFLFWEHHVSNLSWASSRRLSNEPSPKIDIRHEAIKPLAARSPPIPILKQCMRSGRMQSGVSNPGTERNGETLFCLKGVGILPCQVRSCPVELTSHQSLREPPGFTYYMVQLYSQSFPVSKKYVHFGGRYVKIGDYFYDRKLLRGKGDIRVLTGTHLPNERLYEPKANHLCSQ